MAKFIEARVIQKVATEAEWLQTTLPLYQGEMAFVSDKNNFKLNTQPQAKTFAELEYYYKGDILGGVLPTDDLASKPDGVYRATISGTYSGVVVKEGYYTLLRKKDGVWSLESEVKMPTLSPTGKVEEGNTQAVSGGEVFEAVKIFEKEVSNVSIQGYVNKNTGAIVSNDTGFTRSGFIKNENIPYYLDLSLLPEMTAGVATFDADYNRIGFVNVVNEKPTKVIFNTDVKYFIASSKATYRARVYVNTKEIQNLERGNKLTLNFSVTNKYIGKYGEEVSIVGFNSTPFVNVNDYTHLIVYPKQSVSNDASFVFYDENQSPVYRVLSTDLSAQKIDLKAINASYFRACNINGVPEVFTAKNIVFVKSYIETKPNIDGMTAINISFNSDGYVNNSNQIISLSSYSYSNIIDISMYKYIGLVTDRNDSDLAKNLLLKADESVYNVISAIKGRITIIERPLDVKYIRLSKLTSDNTTVLFGSNSLSERMSIDYGNEEVSFTTLVTPSITWENGYYYDSSAKKIMQLGFKTSSSIALTSYTHIILYSNRDDSTISKNLFVNANGDVISILSTIKGERSIISIPTGATHLLLSDSMGESNRQSVQLARGITKTNPKFTKEDLDKLMNQGYFKQHPLVPINLEPDYVNYEAKGIIKTQAVITSVLFLENTVSVPQLGVAFIFSEGQLCAVINGEKYLINLTKI